MATAVFDPHPWAVLELLEAAGPLNFTAWSHPRRAALLARLRRADDPAWEELHAAWAEAPGALPLLDLGTDMVRLPLVPASASTRGKIAELLHLATDSISGAQ